MGWSGVDPQEGREKHQAAKEYEDMHYPGLAEHDEMHEDDGGFNATRTDVHRMDGGGTAHVAERVGHAQQTKATYGDHSPRGAAMPAGGSRDIDHMANAITSPKTPFPGGHSNAKNHEHLMAHDQDYRDGYDAMHTDARHDR